MAKIQYDEWAAALEEDVPKRYEPWSDEECKFVYEAFKNGYSARQIYNAMGGRRTISAIYQARNRYPNRGKE